MNTQIYSLLKLFVVPVMVAVCATLFLSQKSDAATLINASDTLTTSRPSASSPLNAALGATDTQAVIFDNGSFYLASDSAKLIKTTTTAITDAGTIVASQSAALTTVYFAEQGGVAGHAGADVLFVPITAMHKLQFTVPTTIPVSGLITLTFPTLASGDADNTASPSATTFQTNAISSTQIMAFDDAADITTDFTSITVTPATAGNSPIITFTLDGGTSIAAGSVVTLYLGCTAGTSTSCSTQAPRLINPTKSAAAGTADVWKINIQTQDASSNNLDNATVAIGTIESVTVRATVDPTLSFTIAGIANGAAVNLGNTTGCLQTETTNAGIASTSTEVNLGLLANTPSGADVKVGNIAAQRINISTNAAGGYALTATSSGQLINPATGFFLESSTTPTAFPSSGADWFGIHPCGLDVTTATWNTTASTACNTYVDGSTDPICEYAWPATTSPLTLASDATGPIGNSIVTGNGVVSIAYAASVDAAIPPGEYRTVITYVATPTF